MRLSIKVSIAAALLAASLASASAQISLSSAIDLALKSDSRVRMSQASVAKAQAALSQAYDAYIPSATADGGYGKGIGVPTGLPTIFTLTSQSLVFNFSQRDNIRTAASGLESAKFALRDMQSQVEEDVIITYLNLTSDQQRDAALTQQQEYTKRLVTIVQERVDAGQDTRISLLQAQRTSKQIELNQIHLQDEIATLSDHLSRLVGLPGNALVALPASIPELPSVSEIEKNAKTGESFGVLAALEEAKGKQEFAFGQNRYRLRPQVSLGFSYSRIDTGQNDYTQYYPDFKNKSQNAESFYFAVQIPLYDRKHEDAAKEASAEANRSRFEAETQRTLFLESRFKLQRSASELKVRSDLASIDRELAQEQLNAVLAQLTPDAGSTGAPQLTPKDEQNARVAERQKTIELLEAQFQLNQAQVNLLRQTGQLDEWCRTIAALTANRTPTAAVP
jgi:outer membrane protein TolC